MTKIVESLPGKFYSTLRWHSRKSSLSTFNAGQRERARIGHAARCAHLLRKSGTEIELTFGAEIDDREHFSFGLDAIDAEHAVGIGLQIFDDDVPG